MKEWHGTCTRTDFTDSGISKAAELAPLDQILLFDIETTGFSPKSCYCYMIGYCYFQDSVWHYRMLFNDDGRSEYAMINDFLHVLNGYTLLIHYNGDGFDIPFLTEKIRQYQSFGLSFQDPDSLSRIESLDLYKILKPYRHRLDLPNIKLATIEQAMGYLRSDRYNGGELIKVYRDYLVSPSENAEHELYQHNYEDIQAMIPMLSLLNYTAMPDFPDSSIMVHKVNDPDSGDTYIIAEFTLSAAIPLPYHKKEGILQIQCEGDSGRLILPVVREELRYYISNWKDYYYLPVEDRIVHKSLAAYVDSEYKEKATKQNCYLKKTGTFLPIPKSFVDKIDTIIQNTELSKIYQTAPQSTEYYIEYQESFLDKEDEETHPKFLHACIQAMLQV